MRYAATRSSLLERLRVPGDEAAWSQFVDLYGPIVFRLGRKQALSPEECDTLVQDFCCRALSAMPTFRYEPSRGRFRNWVLTVALNEIRQIKRAEAARERKLESYRRELEVRSHAAQEEWWETAEQRQILRLALAELRASVSPEQFGIFELVAISNAPIQSVADFYGVTKPRVSLVKFRMLQRLRKIVTRLAEEYDG